MRYDITFNNGTLSNVGDTCKSWCLEQHYTFAQNNLVETLWFPAIAMLILIINWAFINCPEDVYNKWTAQTGLSKEKTLKMNNNLVPLAMLLLAMYIIYVLVVYAK